MSTPTHSVDCETVHDFIFQFIREEALSPGDRLPSIRKLATASGASVATVHRAISRLTGDGYLVSRVGSGTYISEPEPSETRVIGVICPHSDASMGDFVSDLLRGIRQEVESKSYCSMVMEPPIGLPTEERDERELSVVRSMISLGVTGMIVDLAASAQSQVWETLQTSGIPTICVNNIPPNPDLHAVTVDNVHCGRLAAEHFIQQGHRRFGMVFDSRAASSVLDRQHGFVETLRRHGLEPSPNYQLRVSHLGTPALEKLTARLREDGERPTAFFVQNDPIAVRFLTCLREAGLQVPRDVSLIGVDGSRLGEHVQPRLTSVAQPAESMGAHAASLLLQIMDGGLNGHDIAEMRLKPRLIVRESVATPAAPLSV